MRSRLTAAGLVVVAMLVASPGRGSGFDYHFTDCTQLGLVSGSCYGDRESTQLTYTANGVSISATGYDNRSGASRPGELFVKVTQGNPGETGLGFDDTSFNEIVQKTFIELNLSNLAHRGITKGSLTLSSTLNDTFVICHGQTLGVIDPNHCDSPDTNNHDPRSIDQVLITWNIMYPFIIVTVPNGSSSSVLMAESLSTAPVQGPVPEPSEWSLLCATLVGSVLMVRRFVSSEA
jgi:hypothetical protein